MMVKHEVMVIRRWVDGGAMVNPLKTREMMPGEWRKKYYGFVRFCDVPSLVLRQGFG
jgi:hypothetical protein